MKEARKKPVVIGLILSALFIGAILLWPKPEDTAAASQNGSSEQTEPVIEASGSDWVETVSACKLEEGIQLAKVRGEMMRELIRTNPEQAIREALTLSEWMALPPEIQAHVEQPFSTVANVEVIIACGNGVSETTITTEFPDTGKMETFVYGRRGEVSSKNGAPVQGIRLGDIGALREQIFQTLETADEQAALSLYPVAVPNPGGKSVVALAGGKVFYFKDRAALDEANRRLAKLEELPGPDAGAQALFEELEALLLADGGIDFDAIEAQAYAASENWTGTARDMYVIMCDFSDIPGPPTDPAVFSNSINGIVSQQIWEMSYEKTHIVGTVNTTTYRLPSASTSYVNDYSQLHTDAKALAVADGVDLSPYETVCVIFPDVSGYTWAGLASVGGSRMWLNDNTSPYVVIHELGHNYGSSHASTWTNTASSNPVDPGGGKIEYGDNTDIMGDGEAPEGHFNASHKKTISWFDAENWESISNSGTYRIYRSDHYQTTGLLRGLEINKGASDKYWVGLRQEYPEYDTFGRGAYLIWKKSGDNRSYLLDMTPQSAEGIDDGGLALGRTYSDTSAAVHITPTARGGQTPDEWMDITVNLGSFPGNTAPTASLSGATNLSVQESTVFSVTASDADGDELAYYWDIGDGKVKANSPTLSAAWLTGGTATVSCVVSDMKGGTTTVSQSVVLSSPLDNWTQRTSGTTEDLNDIAVGNGRLVIVGDRWKTYYSDDGTNWTSVLKYNIYLEGVVYDGSQFVAAGRDADDTWKGAIFTSSDGTSWTRRYIDGEYLNDIAYGNGIYVAVGYGGSIVRSTDGINWSTNASGTTEDLDSVSYGDGTFVVASSESGGGPAIVLTSSDGLSWSNYSAGVDLSSWKGFYDVEYCNDRFLAGGWCASISHSTDQGQTFTSMSTEWLVISSFAHGAGTYFAAGINKDNGDADINLISLDGVTWTELATTSQDNRNAAVFFNGTFVTVGDNGSIWQSDAVAATAGGYAMWQLENGAALGFDRDPFDDADFDGYQNLAEYAMGTAADNAGSIPVNGVLSSGLDYFQLSHERDGIKSDIDYVVERASNLVSNDWNSANTVIVNDNATNLTARSVFTIASQTNEFMRLKIELK